MRFQGPGGERKILCFGEGSGIWQAGVRSGVGEGLEWVLASRGHGNQGLGASLLGACLHASSCTRVVSNLSTKLQSHGHITVVHAQHSHLVLGGALSTPQGICPGLETQAHHSTGPQGDP